MKPIKDIDQYISSVPKNVQPILKELRKTIKEVAPDATETINYQMPTFKLNGISLIHFAAWKNHIGLYPTPSVTKVFKKELLLYKVAKGSIQLPISQPLPIPLIRNIVIFRVKEVHSQANK